MLPRLSFGVLKLLPYTTRGPGQPCPTYLSAFFLSFFTLIPVFTPNYLPCLGLSHFIFLLDGRSLFSFYLVASSQQHHYVQFRWGCCCDKWSTEMLEKEQFGTLIPLKIWDLLGPALTTRESFLSSFLFLSSYSWHAALPSKWIWAWVLAHKLKLTFTHIVCGWEPFRMWSLSLIMSM